jgi:hypothetical protein
MLVNNNLYLFIGSYFNDADSVFGYVVQNIRMRVNNELERIWKEAVASKLKVLPP